MAKLTLLAILVVSIGIIGGALQAQDGVEDPRCDELSEADCAIWLDALEASRGVHSASFVAQMTLGITEERENGLFATSLAATIEGRYAVDSDLNLEVAAASEARRAAILRARTIEATSMEADVAIYGPVSDADIRLMGGPPLLSFRTRLADGNIYVDTSTVDSGAREEARDEAEAAWIATNVFSLIDALGQPESGPFGATVATGFDRGLEARDVAQDERAAEFVRVQRLTMDEEQVRDLIGQEAAVFGVWLDLRSLYADADRQQLLRAAMREQADALGVDLSDDDLDLRLETQMDLFQDSEVRFVEYIGIEDGYLHRLEVMVDDLRIERPDAGPVEVDFVLAIEYDDFNDVEPIEAPEDAERLSAEEFIARLALATLEPFGIRLTAFEEVEVTPEATPAMPEVEIEIGETVEPEPDTEPALTPSPEAPLGATEIPATLLPGTPTLPPGTLLPAPSVSTTPIPTLSNALESVATATGTLTPIEATEAVDLLNDALETASP